MPFLTLVTAIVLSFAVVPVSAQGQELYESFVNSLATSFVSVSYEYETEVSGVKVVGEGNLFLQGQSYRYNADGLTVCSDSRSIWIADQAAREMVIESVDESSLGVNPATLLVNLARAFTLKSMKKAGDGVFVYHLLPAISFGIRECSVTLATSGAQSSTAPVLKKASFITDDGTEFILVIKSATFEEPSRSSEFFMPAKMGSDWVVTDLR